MVKAKEENSSRSISPTKKANATLAIEDILLNNLKNKAKEKGTSVNAEVNLILSRHTSCYRFNEIQNGIVVPSNVFGRILDTVDEKNMLTHYKDQILQNVHSILVRENIPLTLENVIKFAFNQILLYSGSYTHFSHFIDKDGGYLNLVFTHWYGDKWSRIIGLAYAEYIKKFLGLNVSEPVIISNTVTIKILEKDNWDLD